MIAINDSFMLESAIYYLLKKHFRQESYYVDLLDLFHEVLSTGILKFIIATMHIYSRPCDIGYLSDRIRSTY